jgi:hypothetical protein
MLGWKQQPDGRIDLQRTVDSADHFRRDAGLVMPKAFKALWPALLWLAAFLFLGDVAVRRVAFDPEPAMRAISLWWARVRGSDVAPVSDYFDKLKSRKAEVGEQLDRSRASTARSETAGLFPGSSSSGSDAIIEGLIAEGDRPRGDGPGLTAPGMGTDAKEPPPETYTNRLLKAKQRVWEDRDKDQGKKPGS